MKNNVKDALDDFTSIEFAEQPPVKRAIDYLEDYHDNMKKHGYFNADIPSVIEHLKALEQSQWQPIEKAEKLVYGYNVGAYSKKYPNDWLVNIAFKMHTGDWKDCNGDELSFIPTHFTDTPTPPNEE